MLSFLSAALLAGLVILAGCATMSPGPERRSFPVKFGERAEKRSALVCAPKGQGPFAAVVFNHGNIVDGWGWPGASEAGYRLDKVCEKLAAEGYFVFAPIREKYPRGKSFMGYKDTYREIVLQAIDHVKALPEVNNTRVALVGFSMGGLVSFKVALERRDLRAVALLAPAPGRGLLTEAAKDAARLSAPLLVMVEESDVPPILLGVASIEDAMRVHGKPLTLIRYNRGSGHQLFYDVGYWWEDLAAFLHEHLDKR
jgi:dienelactone hydrolase